MKEHNKGHYMQFLLRDFHALEALINENRLETGVNRFGYELELNFLNSNLEPAAIGDEVCKQLKNKYFTTEFSRFNLELNSEPVVLGGNCFTELASNLNAALDKVKSLAREQGCEILLTGIIPTLAHAHITPDALTQEPRYQELYDVRRSLKGEQYEYRIHGKDELLSRDSMALFAGCVTSFQTHLQIDGEDIVDKYNWAQMLAGPILSCMTNSPLFLGKRLWHETRIALFEQATDTRNPATNLLRNRPRVHFGDNWLEGSILELLQEDIVNFNTLFTLEEVEDPLLMMERGEAPGLEAWSIFNGSIYRWNRLCYGRVNGRPSLRIENRIFPSGPTVPDMVANAAFWVGAMLGLPQRYRALQNKMAFEEVKENFFKAARLGLDVNFKWLDGQSVTGRELILDELLPIAREGLKLANIAEEDADFHLGIIQARTESGQTASEWMLDSYTELLKSAKRDEALQVLTAGMLTRQEQGEPVHSWRPVALDEGANGYNRFNCVHKFMTTALYKVGEDDVLDLAVHIMDWKRIGHIPVEDDSGKLVGVITKDAIINFMVNAKDRSVPAAVGELMIKDPITVSPETSLLEAIHLLLEKEVSCLPVVHAGEVVGIVTERDFVAVAEEFVRLEIERQNQ